MDRTDTTVGHLADALRTTPDALRKRIVRAGQKYPDIFADTSAAADRTLSVEQVEVLSRANSGRKGRSVRNPRTVVGIAQVEGAADEPVLESLTTTHSGRSATVDYTPHRRHQWRTAVLVALLVAPTAASVHNMYVVTNQLAKTPTDAVLMTIVLSVSALGFIGVGTRRAWSLCLAIVLIAFESFCNLASIYGGLMNAGTIHYGLPTPFLGLVTDIFGSGTHFTAIVLASFTAFFIAAVQYAAIFELNKK